MHRRFGLLLLCTAIVCFGAAPSGPAPLPGATQPPLLLFTPKPAPTSAIGTPTVVVFPIDVENGLDPKVGIALAQITAQEMAAVGGLTVLPVPSGVTRANFLAAARKDHADYYVSGYVTPVGNIAAVVEQLVTVDSGIIIFSQTAQIATVADVASQSLVIRRAILAHSGIVTQNVTTSATPEPTATTRGASVKIPGLGGIVDAVFGHHTEKRAPGPKPTPIVKPARGVIVTAVTAAATLRDGNLPAATSLLFNALNHYFKAQMTAVAGAPSQKANAMCGSDRDMTIAGGTLGQAEAAHHRTLQVFTLTIYTCFGAALYTEVGKGPNVASAVAQAVYTYATAHPNNS